MQIDNSITDFGGSLFVRNPTNSASQNSQVLCAIAGTSANKAIYTLDVSGSHGWSMYTSGNNTNFNINSTYNCNSLSDRLTITSTGNVGIGTATPYCKLDINQGTSGTTGATCFPLCISAGAYTANGNGTATLIGLSTYRDGGGGSAWYKCAVGHCRTGDYDKGSIVFLCNDVANGFSATMSDERMRITSTGNVGIGTVPNYIFEVKDGTGTSGNMTGAYFDTNGVATNITNNYGSICAKFTGAVWTARFFLTSSDIRIKEDIQDIIDDIALQSILSIEPKTYKYVDKLKRGDNKVYGFIAQQIREVIPEAITIEKSYIPNIYLVADYIEGVITLLSQPTKVVIKMNDKIKCYDKDNKEILVEVIEVIDDLTFRIKEIEYTDTKIFVYGTFVDDFHTLNKDYIFTLNVCATQELHRRIEAQRVLLKSQEDRIKDLETKVATLMSM